MTFKQIRQHTPKDARIATYNDVVFYLYTGRPTYYLSINLLMERDRLSRLQESGVRYLMVEPHMQGRVAVAPEDPIARDLINEDPSRFLLRFASAYRLIKIYEMRQ